MLEPAPMNAVYSFAELQNWPAATMGETPAIRLGVFGDPVAHSKSPAMHNAALQACGIDARYCRLHIRAGELEAALRLLPEQDFIGANITIPHKAAALAAVDEADDYSRQSRAVNTVVVRDKTLVGFNTDGPGLVRAIRADFGADLRDLRVMLLGAGGGAGRAIAVQCVRENCERLVLVNRTFEKAKTLAEELAPFSRAARLEVLPIAQLLKTHLENTDLIINATSVGMNPDDPPLLPASLLSPHLMVYDTIYTTHRTPLLNAAEEAGARAANGLSMLLHQGALSFEIWFNRDAPIDAMREALLS
ncbi:MAG: shikimate dehydrogenase [Verrucomicrobiota bacterium]|nr:shikimate dehydrogenase [Verrucomicrobiota bacterium]